MTAVEQYAQSITDRTRARRALADAVTRRLGHPADALCRLEDAYHVACRAQFADALNYCAAMRAAYVACGVPS